MLRRVQRQTGTAGLVVAIVALVFAMLGGAYAATHASRQGKKGGHAGLTSKQKSEIKKLIAQSAKPGPPGSPGSAGKDGANGTNGTNGTDGADGHSVVLVNTNPPNCLGGGITYEVEGSGMESEVCNGEEGEEGEEGQDAGFNYRFSSAIAATDPGSGQLALNNAVAGSATTLSISKTDADSNPITSVIGAWLSGPGAKGTLLVRKAGDPTTFAEYTVVSNKDESTFRNIGVTFIAGHGTFADQSPVTIAYWSSGSTTLPSGAEEKGAWAFSVPGGDDQGHALASISFAIPLLGEVPEGAVFVKAEGGAEKVGFSEHCEGTAGEPKVKSTVYPTGTPKRNTLCVIWEASALVNATFEEPRSTVFFNTGMSTVGGALLFSVTGAAHGAGGWAVEER